MASDPRPNDDDLDPDQAIEDRDGAVDDDLVEVPEGHPDHVVPGEEQS